MRLTALFVLLLSPLALVHAAAPGFTHVWPQWHDAESFDRISEFFGGGENRGRQVVLRTQAGERAGFYFLVRVADAAAFTGATFELQVVRPDAPEPKTFAFAAEAHPGPTVFQLGLTGGDWPGGRKAHPVAWRLALLSADGRVLAEQKSFLWEMPAT